MTKLIVGLVSVLIGLVLAFSPLGGALDRLAYDANFLVRGPLSKAEDVVIVAIDEASFQEIGQQWPWPRSLHAKLLNNLFKHGAKGVAMDIIFSEKSSGDEDQTLAAALERAPNVVLATDLEISSSSGFERQISVQPIPLFQPPGIGLGFAGLPADSDGFVRKLFKKEHPPKSLFSYQAVSTFLQNSNVLPNQGINFQGPVGSIPKVSYYQALQPEKFLPADYFKNKLILVGLSVQSEVANNTTGSDRYPVPYSRWQGGYMSGVEIHASAAQSLILGNTIRSANPLLLFLTSVLLGLVVCYFTYRFTPGRSILPMALLFVLAVVSCYLAFRNTHFYISWPLLLLPAIVTYLSSPFVHFLQTWKEKTYIRGAFSSYVSPQVVNQLIENPALLKLGGSEFEGTVLFLDLAGFTSFSEKLDAEALVDLLNRNLGVLSDIVIANDGMIDKFIGDCIMAVWGAPIKSGDHAIKACGAALQMQRALKLATQAELASSGVKIEARIGINSGTFVAGNIGGSKKLDYTVLGNTVNLASRLEGINKIYQTAIVISEHTQIRLSEDFQTRELDTIRVKGQRQSVKIFALQDHDVQNSDISGLLDDLFSAARSLYIDRNFIEAKAAFDQILQQYPDDGPTTFYSKRCEQLINQPPDKNWDGVYDIEQK